MAKRLTETAWYKRRLEQFRFPRLPTPPEERTVADELEVRRRVRRYAEQVEATGRIDFAAVMLEAYRAGGFDPVPEYERVMVLLPVRGWRDTNRQDCG